jgi:hypothetical protein
MSREQRRLDRRNAGGSPNRRTPVKPSGGGGGGVPWTPIAIVAGFVAIALLIVYLIMQQGGDDDSLTPSERAEQDSSPELAGTFVPSQGRGHFNFSFSLERTPTAFCPGVPWSEAPEGQPDDGTPAAGTPTTGTPAATGTAVAETTPTPGATGTAVSGTPAADGTGTPATTGTPQGTATPTPRTDCYASNPPSSGQHLGVQRNVDVTGNGDLINIPADPDVYPEDVEMPRESIPHILEHAGIYLAWNCAEDNTECRDAMEDMASLANDRIDNHDDRVVMTRHSDLPEGYFGIASWTRFMYFPVAEYDRDVVEDFIADHACRFDPEGFCG